MENKFITSIHIKTSSCDEELLLMRTPFNQSHPDFENFKYRFIAKEMKYEIDHFVCEEFDLYSDPDKADEKFNELLESNPKYLIDLANLMVSSTTEPL